MKEVTGIIDHRILLNFRIDPEVMKKNLPEEFTPKVVGGYAIGGICQVVGNSYYGAHKIKICSKM